MFRAGIFSQPGVHDRDRRESEVLAFVYRGAVQDFERGLQVAAKKVQNQIPGEALGYHFTEGGSGTRISLRGVEEEFEI